MVICYKIKATWLLAAIALVFCARIQAAFITNGGFEAGLAGWTGMQQPGSEGAFLLQSGTTSPITGEAVPAPPEGSSAAMTDAAGPGSRVLFQTFTVAGPVGAGMLVFDLFVGNRAPDFFAPDTLDFATPVL